MKNKNFAKAYIITVDMGYGHQRAVYPLTELAEGGIINANNYAGIPKKDQRSWEGGRKVYEKISRLKHLPLIGDLIFNIMDYFQRIEPFYPIRDLSKATVQLKTIYSMIKKGWGKDLVEKLSKKPLPVITSFFTLAYFFEEHGYKENIYLICCDADVSRAWAPLYPEKSKIKYLVPNRRVKNRLKLYGVKENNIFITGFPLPKENIGGHELKILRKSVGERIVHLDPKGLYRKKYKKTINDFLGKEYCKKDSCAHVLTITFAVGGAGAQREIGAEILFSLKDKILSGEIKLNLIAGIKNDVYLYYQNKIKEFGLFGKTNGNIEILYAETKKDYFQKFNKILLKTDILWTKPSELSFYAGLGLPIIIAPTFGSQEEFNKEWLISIGAGVEQQDPRYVNEWLADWLDSGWLAEAAMNGFLNAPHKGAYHMEEVVLKGKRSEIEDIHLL